MICSADQLSSGRNLESITPPFPPTLLLSKNESLPIPNSKQLLLVSCLARRSIKVKLVGGILKDFVDFNKDASAELHGD